MKEQKLMSMVEFVKEQEIKRGHLGNGDFNFRQNVVRYANLLSQPLTLGMFVPCDENGEVLEEPIDLALTSFDEQIRKEQYEDEFQQAKERVLFEGLYNSHHTNEFNTQLTIKHKNGFRQIILEEYDIEGLITLGFSITLTQNAIKTIYG